jgi:hypothetical protein
VSSSDTQDWIRLLLARGYRLDQLIVDERTGSVGCSTDDLAAAAALVQNPHKIDPTRPEILQKIRELLLNGRLAHHLVISASSNIYYDTEQVTTDCETVAFGRFGEKPSRLKGI